MNVGSIPVSGHTDNARLTAFRIPHILSSRIRTQTILLSVVPVAFLLILLVIALLIQRTTLASADWSANSERTLAQSDRVAAILREAGRAGAAYGAKHDSQDLRAYRAAQRAMPAELEQLIAMSTVPEQRARAQRLAASTTRGMNLIATYVHLMSSGRVAQARVLATQPATQALGRQIERDTASFNAAQSRLANEHTHQVRARVFRYEWILIVCCVLGVLTSLYMTVRFGFSIVQRLQLLAESAQRLGSGAPSEPIEGDDEIAVLDRVYHMMTHRIQREHAVASVLQKALLPHDLPAMPGLRIDAAYTPAARESEVGGDWYDVFALSPTCIGISVGDVAGHGLHAASVMGTARQAIRTAAFIDSEPSNVLFQLNRMACMDSSATVITSFFSTLDLTSGTLRYAVAGHPAPLTIRSGGEVALLEGRGLMLGVQPNVQYQTYETTLDVGSGLLLYTDGIVEPSRNYLQGMDALVESLRTACSEAPQNVAQAIQRHIASKSTLRDDAAILFVGVTQLVKEARFDQPFVEF